MAVGSIWKQYWEFVYKKAAQFFAEVTLGNEWGLYNLLQPLKNIHISHCYLPILIKPIIKFQWNEGFPEKVSVVIEEFSAGGGRWSGYNRPPDSRPLTNVGEVASCNELNKKHLWSWSWDAVYFTRFCLAGYLFLCFPQDDCPFTRSTWKAKSL